MSKLTDELLALRVKALLLSRARECPKREGLENLLDIYYRGECEKCPRRTSVFSGVCPANFRRYSDTGELHMRFTIGDTACFVHPDNPEMGIGIYKEEKVSYWDYPDDSDEAYGGNREYLYTKTVWNVEKISGLP